MIWLHEDPLMRHVRTQRFLQPSLPRDVTGQECQFSHGLEGYVVASFVSIDVMTESFL